MIHFEDTYAWEKCKLGDVTKINTGKSDVQDSISGGEYPFFIRSEEVQRSNKYLFDGEAILIPGEGRLGDIYHYINGKFDYHQRVYKISDFKNSDGKFILYALQQSFKRHALTHTVKATVDSLRLPIIQNFSFLQPQLQEQEGIGRLFRKIDKLIEVNKNLTERYQLLKKSLLQQMFV